MKEMKIQIESLSLTYRIENNNWKLQLPKSQTRIQHMNQLRLLTEESDFLVPVNIEDQDDIFTLSFLIDQDKKNWIDIKKLNRHEKLRALYNISKLYSLFSSRITFFLHPNNVVFDDNLMPRVIYRGIRDLVPPFEMNEEQLLKQYKCYIISLFSDKYSFDDLYNGSLKNANSTEFEKQVNSQETFQQLVSFINKSYSEEHKMTQRTMQLVSKKRFKLFKQLSIIMIIVSVILLVPLVYYIFIKSPYQEKLLLAHRHFLATDYTEVINTLQKESVEKLPYQAKYILAHSYVTVEKLSDKEKEVIMKNISLKSDKHYLMYWIYNGRGNFDESIDLAKYLDDPQLIIYGLIKYIEQVKNDPELTGSERDEQIKKLQDDLEKIKEEYGLDEEEELEEDDPSINDKEDDQKEKKEKSNKTSK